jgi:REP element-mobilizing transposase RayT
MRNALVHEYLNIELIKDGKPPAMPGDSQRFGLEMAKQKGCEIVEGHLMADYVHLCLSIPPKYAVSHVVSFIKGKSAISIARTFRGKTKNFTGENFWARGFFCINGRA